MISKNTDIVSNNNLLGIDLDAIEDPIKKLLRNRLRSSNKYQFHIYDILLVLFANRYNKINR